MHTLFEYPLGKPLEAKLLRNYISYAQLATTKQQQQQQRAAA